MKLLYGTGNKAKLVVMRDNLHGSGIEVIGPDDIGVSHPQVDEDGNDPLENARVKAWAYFRAARMPTFSCDSGLYIDGLDDGMQPGVHVRMVNGCRLDDEQMIAHYSALAGRLGGRCLARYRNAICLILDGNTIYEHMGDDISGERFIISSKPHEGRNPGFPLNSLSVHVGTGRYYMDMGTTRVSSTYAGFRAFFERVLEAEGRFGNGRQGDG